MNLCRFDDPPTIPGLAGRLLVMLTLVGVGGAGGAVGDEPPIQVVPPAAIPEVKPLPPTPIPHDPPPHQGAMIDLPYTIEPPDILVVEVLESLPGRPITGERLVRPDGTISLGFYGDVHVRGLTVEQAKVKIIAHLTRHMTNEVLGLTRTTGLAIDDGDPDPRPAIGSPPTDQEPPLAPPVKPNPLPPGVTPVLPEPGQELAPPKEDAKPEPPKDGDKPEPKPGDTKPESMPADAPGHGDADGKRKDGEPGDLPVVPQGEMLAVVEMIEPKDSTHVFVDVAAYNSKVYYVQGWFAQPGRLPSTGNDTVLDALNFAGGLLPDSDPASLVLFRPARGGAPARRYPLNLDAIQQGDEAANLQLFRGDRLVVNRKPGHDENRDGPMPHNQSRPPFLSPPPELRNGEPGRPGPGPGSSPVPGPLPSGSD